MNGRLVRRHRLLRCIAFGCAIACFVTLGVSVQAQEEPSRNEADPVAAELHRQQGTWQVVSSVRDGKEGAPEIVSSIQRIVRDDHVVWKRAGKSFSGSTLVLDPAQEPRAIDILPDGGPARDKRVLGIYKFDEHDRLVICMADPDEARPTRFSAEPGSRQTLMTFTKVAEPQEPAGSDSHSTP